jgi:sugar/nucleoside kinase (ribokinase family)
MHDVVVVGDYCLDLIFAQLEAFPKLGMEVVSRSFGLVPGAAYNPVVAMHRLGLRVGWAGDFGDDEFSRTTLRFAAEEGLDKSLFVHHARPLRRITASMTFPEDRAFVAYYDPDPKVPAAVRLLPKIRTRLVYIPGMYTGPAFGMGVRFVRAQTAKLVMDGNLYDPDAVKQKDVVRVLGALDAFLPNLLEAQMMTGETEIGPVMERLRDMTKLPVVKAGERGAYAIDAGELIHCPPLPIQPLDTTGAGDCFSAGFIKAWLDGLPLEDCLRWGNVVGGLSTLGHGGTGQVTRPEDVLPRLATLKCTRTPLGSWQV